MQGPYLLFPYVAQCPLTKFLYFAGIRVEGCPLLRVLQCNHGRAGEGGGSDTAALVAA